jgi:hypothetical protein
MAMKKIEIAKIAHGLNRIFCQSIGDFSQPIWPEAPDWQKKSALNGVNFHQQNKDAGDDASHNSWMKEKEADGWVYGEVKDPEKKTHPCMVPFEKLPKEQQAKDALFAGVCRALLPLVSEA